MCQVFFFFFPTFFSVLSFFLHVLPFFFFFSFSFFQVLAVSFLSFFSFFIYFINFLLQFFCHFPFFNLLYFFIAFFCPSLYTFGDFFFFFFFFVYLYIYFIYQGHESKFIQTIFSIPPLFYSQTKHHQGKLKTFLSSSHFLSSHFSTPPTERILRLQPYSKYFY